MCSPPNSHTSGELPNADARQEPEASTSGGSKSGSAFLLFAPPSETPARNARVGLRLTLAVAGEQAPPWAVENLLVSFSFASSEAAEESSRLDLVYFTLKKKRKDTGAILYLKEPQTSEEKILIEAVIHNSN